MEAAAGPWLVGGGRHNVQMNKLSWLVRMIRKTADASGWKYYQIPDAEGHNRNKMEAL